VFDTGYYFHISLLIFSFNARRLPIGGYQEATALPVNIRPGWLRVTVTKNLANHDRELIMSVKSFRVQAHGQTSAIRTKPAPGFQLYK
jgi:hypothetical protein